MTWVYRHRESGEVVERDKRDPRLDYLSHRWERIAPRGEKHPPEPEQPAPEPVEPEPVDESPPEPPARSANRAEWERYARTRGATGGEIEDMTKPQLVERYG